jgi:uroporphyrinogen decarboxylase
MRKTFKPDIEYLLKILRREKTDRPVLFEFIIDDSLLRRHSNKFQNSPAGTLEYFLMVVDSFKNLGYDYAPIYPWDTNMLTFTKAQHATKESYSLNEAAVITDRSSFEKYVWPEPQQGDYDVFETISPSLPDGMKLMACSNGGILENAFDLCGFENLCMISLLDSEFTREIFENIGRRLLEYYQIVSAFDSVGVCVVNDDWGFKTQTMFSPELMRKYVFPWMRKIIQIIHENGKPVILHSCGNLKAIMNDIIDDLEINGKHSFEDEIYPIEDAYDWWHDRIALLGGIDVGFLCTKSPDQIRDRSINLLKRTSDTGAYALGSGNSIPPYVPEGNYLAMISSVEQFE